MQLAILGILVIGGALLFIYFALNSRQTQNGKAASKTAAQNGKVIYLFGPDGKAGSDKNAQDGDKGDETREAGHEETGGAPDKTPEASEPPEAPEDEGGG
ncbi:MAG: hypothetical protein LBT26_08855 [Clostridiales Family XIII bacterium]|jgi:hypothetical protein|nr:hypothetical protein [Clostridiales Family XIII bacterium]